MKKYLNHIIFVVIVTTVFIVLLMAPPKQIKYYPADDIHLNAAKSTTKKEMHKVCGKCHFEGGEKPIPPTHIKRERCYGCHMPKPAEEKK